MTPVRQVVLVLSERCAVALEETLENVPVPMLIELREEIAAQLAVAPVLSADAIASHMAKAASAAVRS